jgi:hypothetical protein
MIGLHSVGNMLHCQAYIGGTRHGKGCGGMTIRVVCRGASETRVALFTTSPFSSVFMMFLATRSKFQQLSKYPRINDK